MKKLLIPKQDFLILLIGTTILALGINWFTSPLNLVMGGLSGITIIVKAVSEQFLGFGIPLWLTNFVLNVPLFIVSIKQRGLEFAKKSAWSVGILTLALWYTEFIPNFLDVKGDLLLGSLFGGIIIGFGIGIILKTGATTGGTDMLATIIKYRYKQFQIAKLILIIDGVIILSGMMVFGSIKAMYAMIALVINSRMITFVLEGMNYARIVFILSNHSEEIADVIMHQLPRGVTGIQVQGMYTKQNKQMLYVVVSPKEITRLREMVKKIDATAFITISDAREVLGQGFIEEI